jgi:hypothetical protein
LKCTTSPNDMEMDSFQGVPDTYDGRTIAKRFTSVSTYTSPTTALDTYILLAPTPGVAYWTATCTAGSGSATLAFAATNYPDATTLFVPGADAAQVSAFRYASNVIELVPTTNEMTWQGNIQVYKGYIEQTSYNGSTSTETTVLTGFEVCNSVKPGAVFPYNCGVYSVTAPADPIMPWVPIVYDTPYSNISTISANRTISFTNSGLNYLGLGKHEIVLIKLPAVSTASVNSGILRTWACVEFQVNSNSILYDYSRISPPHDPLALELARRFIHENPSAVPFYDNDTFWQRVNAWIIKTTGVLKLIPGRVGAAAGAVNLLSHTIDPMLGARDSIYDLD